MANDATLTDGWSQAYETDFTQGGGHGRLPIVVSYDSSPAFTVPKGFDTSTTRALLDTCFRQVEYAGVLAGAPEPRRAPRRSSTSCSAPRCRRRCPTRCTSSRSAAARRCPRPGRGSPCSRRTRSTSAPPTSPRTATPGSSSGAASSADDTTRLRRLLTLAATAADPPAGAGDLLRRPRGRHRSRGFVQDGHLDVAGVFAVLGRPEIQRAIWFTLWSSTVGTALACLLGLPAAHVLHRLALPGPHLDPRPPGRALRAAHGRRRGRLRAGDRPRRTARLRLGLDGSPIAIVAGLVFFNASVVIRVVGGAWESLDPRPAEAAAALGASPWQVLRDVTFPALRPALVSAATVVFLFCATAFGIVLTLGGLRYSSVETQIYLLTTTAARPPGRGRALGAAAGGRHRSAARGGPRPSYAGRHGRPLPGPAAPTGTRRPAGGSR